MISGEAINQNKQECPNFLNMKPVGPEQTQDTYEHDHIALCVSKLKK